MNRWRWAFSGALVIVLAAVGGVALASIPDANGVIHACRKNSTGEIRVIDSATQTCPSGTVPLNWSQTGPQGPAGATGPASVNGYEIIRYSETVHGTGRFGAAVACPTGKVATGWDAWATDANGGGTGNVALGILSQNGDATQGTANQVNFSIDADFTQPVNGPGAIHASVVCIKAA
jgi:hypothetical protein